MNRVIIINGVKRNPQTFPLTESEWEDNKTVKRSWGTSVVVADLKRTLYDDLSHFWISNSLNKALGIRTTRVAVHHLRQCSSLLLSLSLLRFSVEWSPLQLYLTSMYLRFLLIGRKCMFIWLGVEFKDVN